MPSLGIFKLLIWLRVIQTSIIYKELMLLIFFPCVFNAVSVLNAISHDQGKQ